MKRTLFLVFAMAAATSAPAAGQSLFSTRGLGVPIFPVDARARALGGIGVGLLGLNTSLVNPAEVAGLGRRGVAAAVQPVSGTTRFEGVEADFAGSRFPLVRILFPLRQGLVVSAGYGAFLDQSWGVVRTGTEIVGDRQVAVEDLVRSSGGIAQGTLGVAYSVTPRIALGLAGGVYTGHLDRGVTRSFPDDQATLQPFQEGVRWDYSGPFATFGVRFDPDPALRIGASVTASGDLDARVIDGQASDATFRLPVRFNAGASGWLSPLLLATVGVERGGAPGEPAIADPGAGGVVSEGRATWRVGGGLEYEGVRGAQRVYPIRLGGQWAQLPYAGLDEETPTEWSVSTGIGFRLAGDELGPLAVLDAAIERGGREGFASTRFTEGLTESFWRFTVSLALFGR
jgi:hypothetical protein